MIASLAAVVLVCLQSAGTALPVWEFKQGETAPAWVANEHLAEVSVSGGEWHGRAINWDPMIVCKGLDFPASPWQYVVVRIKATRPGSGELFWAGDVNQGPYDGFSAKQSVSYTIDKANTWQDVVIFPFWQTEKTIRQLRLDVYADASYQIDSIRIASWGDGLTPSDKDTAWTFEKGIKPWQVYPGCLDLMAPPLHLDVATKGYAHVRLLAKKECKAGILWANATQFGSQVENFTIRGDGQWHDYNIELQAHPEWHDVVAFGLRLPDKSVKVESLSIAETPEGPAELHVRYLGMENGVNRAGRHAGVLALIENIGGSISEKAEAVLAYSWRIADSENKMQDIPPLEPGDQATLTWDVVQADSPITADSKVTLNINGQPVQTASVQFEKSIPLMMSDYVPRPLPIKTDVDVCAYYFPGWNADAKWDCIRKIAPVRKPLLGYYDEAKPECVDWQIKWAVENGVSCFLVDWYWCAGQQHLTHWFDAYRQAKYRDLLKVAIMWANHNPPNTHTREDWRAVTKEWITRYFSLPGYYQVDGKPAVFLWAPDNLRNDLKGSEEVKAALDESRAMAVAAGFPGITFIAMSYNLSETGAKQLLAEGYNGVTTYHEWGASVTAASTKKGDRISTYDQVVKEASAAWETHVKDTGALTYYPVVDTGWDSRPWHGENAFYITGRTPKLFEKLLEQSRAFLAKNPRQLVVVGPVNEWGEGSYIEPNTEFGFSMYEAIRNVFGTEGQNWPVNIGPADLKKYRAPETRRYSNPFDFAPVPLQTSWVFEQDPQGWSGMMGTSRLEVKDKLLQFDTASDDPALVIAANGMKAGAFSKLIIEMQMSGVVSEKDGGQLFWSSGGQSTSEAASIRFPITADGTMQTYTISLKSNPRWRGRIATIRLDPCNAKDVHVAIRSIRFE